MRAILCLALMFGALLLFPSAPAPVSGCTDYDQDGVCAPIDCNDFNPTIAYDGDDDGDGFTVCQGDCADDDPTIHKCKDSLRQYPVFYNPPEQPCQSGYTLTTQLFHCYTQPDGTRICDPEPFYQYDSPFLRDCFPIG
ncbi:MAG TPA: hypothetical protein VF703_11885 [Pyrinomonadaceae bacterium]|jgi:hypothetical protein